MGYKYYVPKDWMCRADRWREMVYFCRQYQALKQELNDIRLEYRASMNGSIAVKSSGASSPVEQKVLRMDALTHKITLIEQTLRDVAQGDGIVYTALLTAVTTNTKLEYIGTSLSVRTLSRYKRAFFYLLDQRL